MRWKIFPDLRSSGFLSGGNAGTSLIFGAILLLMPGCETTPDAEHGKAAGPDAALATQMCGSCHLVPSPADLPRHAWDTIVFPRMKAMMPAASYTAAEWEGLKNSFLLAAPEELAAEAITTGPAADFSARFPTAFFSPPSTSYLSFLAGGGFLAADINKESLTVYDARLDPVSSLRVGSGVTDLILTAAGETFATVIGSFSPTDEASGQLIRLTQNGAEVVGSGLRRPTSLVELRPGELIVTEFGKWEGRLSRWTKDDAGRYQRDLLAEQTGPLSVVVEGPDRFLVLYGQGREEIVRYHRQPDNGFRRETLVTFPPSYGSCALTTTDWNGDAYPDLLHVAGDNADYRPFVKPYHGIRIYEGTANGTYQLADFIPLPGAYAAVAADFDGNGTRDIAAISFFPDFTQDTPLSATVFHRRGDHWEPRPLPAAGSGRWLRLTAGDWDGDGDTDLAAGSLAMEAVPDRGRMAGWLENGLGFVVWENEYRP